MWMRTNLNVRESPIRARFVPDSFTRVKTAITTPWIPSHFDTYTSLSDAPAGPCAGGGSYADLVQFARGPRPACPGPWRHGRSGADQYRQDPSRNRAHAGAFVRADRAAAAPARARSLQQGVRTGGQR